jgi:hypothetical protein
MKASKQIKDILKKYGTKQKLTDTRNDWGYGGSTGYKYEAVINGQTFSAYYKKVYTYKNTDPVSDVGYYVGDTRFVGLADWISEDEFLTLLKASIEKREHFIIRQNNYNSNMDMSTQYPLNGDAEAFIGFANVQLKEWKKLNEMDNTPEILSRKEAVEFFTKVIPMRYRHYALFQSAP